jgi:hypothetical protein
MFLSSKGVFVASKRILVAEVVTACTRSMVVAGCY